MDTSKNMVVTINKNGLEESIESTLGGNISQILKQEMLNYYTQMTLEEKQKRLKQYQQKFEKMENTLKHSKSIQEHFQAYELILQFRKFILGKLGQIDYIFMWKVNTGGSSIVKTAVLDSEKFIDLLKDKNGNLIGFESSETTLRFNKQILSKLNKIIKDLNAQGINITINEGYNSFSIINENIGSRVNFKDSGTFRSLINFIQSRRINNTIWYEFMLELQSAKTKEDKAIFALKVKDVITKDNASSSSIFSAIGKYFADEMRTKKEFQKQNPQINMVDIKYPNEGVLSEMYVLAKARLNKGKNRFRSPQRRIVQGDVLLKLYNEAKNKQPFYSGGDFLMDQIKSFLGSNPSLTSFATIYNTIVSFNHVLKNQDFEQMKQQLSKKILQKSSENNITKQEEEMSQALTKALDTFFSDLTK